MRYGLWCTRWNIGDVVNGYKDFNPATMYRGPDKLAADEEHPYRYPEGITGAIQEFDKHKLTPTMRKYSKLHWLVPTWNDKAEAHLAFDGTRLCDKVDFPTNAHYRTSPYSNVRSLHESRTPLGVVKSYVGRYVNDGQLHHEDRLRVISLQYARPICNKCAKVMRLAIKYAGYRMCSIHAFYITVMGSWQPITPEFYYATQCHPYRMTMSKYLLPAHDIMFSETATYIGGMGMRHVLRDLSKVMPKAMRMANSYRIVRREHPGYERLFIKDVPYLESNRWAKNYRDHLLEQFDSAGVEPTVGNLYIPGKHISGSYKQGIGAGSFAAFRNNLMAAGYPDFFKYQAAPTQLVHKSAEVRTEVLVE